VSPRQKQVTDMRQHGMSIREIAGALGIQMQSVKDHIQAAKHRKENPGRKPSPAIQEARRIDAAMKAAIASEPVGSAALAKLFPNLTRSQIKKSLYRLQDHGLAKSSGRGKFVVWGHPDALQHRAAIKAQEMRDAAALRQKMAEDKAATVRQQVRKKLAEKPVRSAVTVDIRPTAPTVSIAAGKHQYPIDTSKAKITIVPTPKGRFHVEIPMGSGAISQDWLARRMA
jgi:hypothetical protein